jgi:hypothetical protein
MHGGGVYKELGERFIYFCFNIFFLSVEIDLWNRCYYQVIYAKHNLEYFNRALEERLLQWT